MRKGARRLVRLTSTITGMTVIAAGAAFALSRVHAGPQGDGTGITPVGWRLTPVGHQAPLGDLPTAIAASHDGDHLLVVNAGQATQSLQVADGHGDVVQTIEYKAPEALYAGVAWSPDGQHAYASAGGNNKIRTYDVAGGTLTEGPSIPIPTSTAKNPFPAGLAVAPDGGRLFVADQLGDAFSAVTLAGGAVTTVPAGHNPYGVALSPDGHTAYVSNQGADTVSVFDVSGTTPVPVRTVTVGTHPNRLVVDLRNGTVYVANSESDSVSVIPEGASSPSKTVNLSPYQGAPVGSNPDGLVLSADGKTLYVANSGNNDVAVVDVPRNRVAGMIPTAWYPTDVALSPDGGHIYVSSAKGLGAGPNNGPGYPNPTSSSPTSPNQYVGSMMVGSLSAIATPDGGQLARYSDQVVANDGFDERDHQRTQAVTASPLPGRQGGASPIRHVIYIVKENRTYDQEFGSLGKGNGDPSLNLFGDESAPNARALQRQFVTLDNFYADAEISAQGWNWSTGANSNPYVEQTWPANYSPRNHLYDYEGGNLATAPNEDPANSFLWDRMANAGVSFRNYGFFKGAGTFNTGTVTADPLLVAHDDPNFWGYDLGCPDSTGTFTVVRTCPVPRVDEWAREFGQYVTGGNLPAVQLLRLPNDHTAGTRVGAPTPQAYVADNDYALGRVVDTVSHSPYWASTAIFVVEDDAQNGPDHVDAHRTIAQVISPYTRTGKVDSTFYSTVSMLRTMELLTGLGPLTQFDAAATPMFNAFTGHPDTTPYSATKPDDSVLTAVNGAHAPLAAEAAEQDLSSEDRIDMTTFNQEVWQSVKGTAVPMPAPRHR